MRSFFGLVLLGSLALFAKDRHAGSWKFAVSGDSRNCGDMVMPAIAAGVQKSGAAFYWHLGDFRSVYRLDEDMSPPVELGLHNQPLDISTYLAAAWPDFIVHQLVPFGALPVYLLMGNHEAIPPLTREAWLVQFADWLETPAIRAQRLKDDPQDHKLHAYYHWTQRNVDFIALDNSTPDQFDPEQMKWWVTNSGREAYEALWHAQDIAHKNVSVLASHSHFYMDHVFDTADWKDKVLPGWISGTAGAPRYKLPLETTPAQHAETNVYGYMIATVAWNGDVSFAFERLSLEDLRAVSGANYPEPLIRWCYENNHQ